MKFQTDLLFPTPVQIVDLENKDLCVNTADLILKKIPADFKSNLNTAFTTTDTLHLESSFETIKNTVINLAEQYSTNVLGLEKDSLVLNAMWANVRKNYSKHHIHQHPNSFVSGVMYLQIPTDTELDTFFFVDPRPAKNMFHGIFEKESPISNRSWWYTPKEGCVIMFPSWLEHGTDEFFSTTNNYRISLSFNLILKKFIRH